MATPARRSHRRNPPSYLPRIETPPEHGIYRSDSDLRRDSYGTIPPLNPRRQRAYSPEESGDDDEDRDSWGAPGYSSDEDYHQMAGPAYPQMAPYPVVFYPPPYMYGAPPHSFHPQVKPPPRKKHVRYAAEPEILRGRTPPWTGSNSSHKRSPHKQTQHFDPFDPVQNPILMNYQYPYISQERRHGPDIQASIRHFQGSPSFQSRLIDGLISEFLEESIVPDLLIDLLSLKTIVKQLPPNHAYYWPSFDACVEFLDDEMPLVIYSVVREVVQEMATDFIARVPRQNIEETIFDEILKDLLKDESATVVKVFVKEFADSHLQRAAAYDVVMEMVDEFIASLGPSLTEDAIHETSIDMMVEDVIDVCVGEMCRDVVMETMKVSHDRRRQRHLLEISKYAKEKVLDGIMLEHLVAMVARQGRVWNTEESAEAMVDSIILSVLLEQQFGLTREPRMTNENKPLSRFHEKSFTEVALDTILASLSDSLTEDLNDLDELEQGLWDPQMSRIPDWAVLLDKNG